MSNSVPFILTTEQLAQAYETTPKIVLQNFRRHKEEFIEGKDYVLLEGEELKKFDDLNLKTSLSEKDNLSPSMVDDFNLKPSMVDDFNLKPSMVDDFNLSPSMVDDDNLSSSNFDDDSQSTSMIDMDSQSSSKKGGARRRYLWTQTGAFIFACFLNTPQARKAYKGMIELAEKPQQALGIAPEAYTALQEKYKDILDVAVKAMMVRHLDDSDLGHEQIDDIETVLYRVREELKKLRKADAILPVLKELEKLLNTLEMMIAHTNEKLEQTDKQFIDQAVLSSKISADVQLLARPALPLLESPKG